LEAVAEAAQTSLTGIEDDTGVWYYRATGERFLSSSGGVEISILVHNANPFRF